MAWKKEGSDANQSRRLQDHHTKYRLQDDVVPEVTVDKENDLDVLKDKEQARMSSLVDGKAGVILNCVKGYID